MFILLFIVMFGPKKGALAAYFSAWGNNFSVNFCSIILLIRRNRFAYRVTKFADFYQIRVWRPIACMEFQFTAVTSRLTSYFLFSFWLFFFFFGESLLMVILNYVTLTDAVVSSSFVSVKQHSIFFLTTVPVKLVSYLNFYIYFLTSCALLFLLNFNYLYNYNYFKHSTFTTLAALVIIQLLVILHVVL